MVNRLYLQYNYDSSNLSFSTIYFMNWLGFRFYLPIVEQYTIQLDKNHKI